MGKTDLSNPPRSGLYARSTPSEKRHKPSAPIKIPIRQRNALSPTFSPTNGPMSPELMFDMSPHQSSFLDHYSSSSDSIPHYSSSVHRSSGYRHGFETPDHTPPFMYPFPRPSAAPTRSTSASDHYTPLPSLHSGSSPLHSSSKLPSPPPCSDSPLLHDCLLNGAFDEELQSYTESEESAFASRGRSRHNTCRQSSGLPSPSSTCYRTRNSSITARSFTSSSIFDEDEGIYLEEENRTAVISESSTDVNWFEVGFSKHLMKRVKNEKPTRAHWSKTKVVPSLRVTVGSWEEAKRRK